jgi:hypothetical protein
MAKIKITTSLELNLKEAFDLTECVHHKGFGEALERGVRSILIEMNHSSYLDAEITRTEQESLILVTKSQKLKAMKEQLSTITAQLSNDNGNGKEDEDLSNLRESLFEKSKESIIKLWYKNDIGWDSVIPKYKFLDKKEAQAWFRNKIKEMEA